MRHFKATITYEMLTGHEQSPQQEEVMYCCGLSFPKSEQLKEIFYRGNVTGKKYLSSHWGEISEGDLPAGAGLHAL